MTICNITGYACDCQPDDRVPCDGVRKLREACEGWKKQSIERGQEIDQLRGEVSLAAEGLANYHQEALSLHEQIAVLQGERDRLRQDIERIKMQRLDWAMLCDHDCPACTALDDAIRGDAPQKGDPSP